MQVRDENAVYAKFAAATGTAREALGRELDTLLRRHATGVSYLVLGERNYDIINTAVWLAFEHLDGFKGEAKFSTWFHAIVLHECQRELKKRKKRAEQSLDELSEADASVLSVEQSHARLELAQLAKELTGEEQEIVLGKLEGRSDAEIVAKLGVELTPGGFRNKWFRIREKMLSRLEEVACRREES